MITKLAPKQLDQAMGAAAQNRQKQCNVSSDAAYDTAHSAFTNNLGELNLDGRLVKFDCKLITKSDFDIIIDLPDDSKGCVDLVGFKKAVELTARLAATNRPQSGSQVKAIVISHTTLRERFRKDLAALSDTFVAAYRMHLGCGGTPPPIRHMFDYIALKRYLEPYLLVVINDTGDTADDGLAVSWAKNRTLGNCHLSPILHDFWYGKITRRHVLDLKQTMATNLATRL
jgi:hypothetical protein